MTKDSTARGTNTPFILSCYISFFKQLLLIIHTASCQCFVLSNISEQVFPSLEFEENNRIYFFFSISSSLIFQLWNSTADILFSLLGGNVLSFWGLQEWNNRNRKLLATHWAVWWGDSRNCTGADSLSGQVLCVPFRG